MKTRSYVTVGCMFVMLFAGAGLAQATTLVNYDFSSLATGNLVGQDGWTAINSWSSLAVTNGTGAANNSGDSEGGSRPLSLPAFSSTDTLVATARFYSTVNEDTVVGLVDGNQSNTNWLPGFGLVGGNACFRDVVNGQYNEHLGASLTMGDTYDVQATIDLSVGGGRATIAYRDITSGQTAFTQDSSLVNVPMGLTQDGAGKYDFNAMALRIIPYGTGISQFTLTSNVPEPSACALLITGLLGLLAYAWRKRR